MASLGGLTAERGSSRRLPGLRRAVPSTPLDEQYAVVAPHPNRVVRRFPDRVPAPGPPGERWRPQRARCCRSISSKALTLRSGAKSTSIVASRRPAHHPRPRRMAACRDAQDPRRPRLLPPARRRGLPYANICEQHDNHVTAAEFIPQIQAQLADITALRDDAAQRGWHTEVARHSRVITSIQKHLQRLERAYGTGHNA